MNKENLNRLKKYLFFISVLFFILFGTHILYVYLYDGSKESPIDGGSVSEGIIGDFPHLNPLLISSDYNKNIIYMLYRGLLKYDYEKNEIIGDLAKCDIKDLKKIDCFLKDNIFWSNGDKITSADIITTFNFLKNSNINNSLSSLLKETTIEEKSGIITFYNKVKDVNFLNVLFQPIVSKKVLDNIGNKELYGRFNPLDGQYSGPYKVEIVSYDEALGIQKLILSKNEYYKEKNILLSKYIYKIFKDSNQLLKHKDTINIFFDKNKLLGDSVPRLNKNSYYLNQYNSIFINEERINSYDLRSFILGKIDLNNILQLLGKGYKEVYNPFLSEDNNLKFEIKNLNIESIIKDMGYYKKYYLADVIKEDTKKIIQEKNNILSNNSLKYIFSPINKKYNFLSQDNILIEGNIIEDGIEAIYINDYKLKSYKKGEKKFYYKLNKSFKNLNPGENKYKVYFEKGGKKEFKEEFIINYSSDKNKLLKLEKDFNEKLNNNFSITSSGEILNTEKQKQILSLEDNYYYDKNLKKFSLRLYYIESKQEHLIVANAIKTILETYGILTEIFPITINDLNNKILSGEKDYDLLIVGIDLGYFKFNLYPYFHSSQSKFGFNFSNIKDLNLDILLEDLKSNVIGQKEIKDSEKKIIQILNEKQVFKTLYSKKNIVLVDNNIKNFSLNENIPSNLAVIEKILNSYITIERSIDFSKKSILDFINFIKKIL